MPMWHGRLAHATNKLRENKMVQTISHLNHPAFCQSNSRLSSLDPLEICFGHTDAETPASDIVVDLHQDAIDA